MEFRTFEELVAVTMVITQLMFRTAGDSQQAKDMLVQYAISQIKLQGGVDQVIRDMKQAVLEHNQRQEELLTKLHLN